MHESLDEIERFIIGNVKEIRKSKGISQTRLSLAIGKSTTFIADIEASSKKAKYNVIHLNLIAIALGCSPKDFLPDHPICEKKYDFIKEIK
ncbi:helix-turn-helix domain-containing protein [Elizabethkingia anophelis]|uniref:helix-turn-helix domain-containing protein n=1 Tax=Elizabethkingia anophelis TaxID=1117645 RepID=UPI000D047FB1|nr:helix-turn-helix transcriptional regulator [Elizabethkingia anophelis]MCL1689427.1 helix-turn-helix transcriptional regulator [Elizabethkingia anophelis]MDV4009441.1 transcriptional regulator [Elizabethkingia anophelis]MYY46369.1 XRE family transcriptional regulator [Elizabethkingia anophelis]PRQ84111.1 transcriptional regulator [Elizabethkingia anophelis]PRQ85011.1 transcriptional regulator [Elizabethkingia anophelis]